jgi:hypothetical protein|tara:strand:- start:1038 stop:2390 length:1353 start_codon:yes stop_codon:yes gene_type:complete
MATTEKATKKAKYVTVKVNSMFMGKNPRAAAMFPGIQQDLKIEELMGKIMRVGRLTDAPKVWPTTDEHRHGEFDVHYPGDEDGGPVWMVVKGHRRLAALRMLSIMHPDVFKIVCPKGEIQCDLFESDDYEGEVIPEKMDHAHVVGLTSVLDVLVNIEACIEADKTREQALKELYPVLDAAHGRTFHGKRRATIAKLDEQINALAPGDDIERAILKEKLLEEIVHARTGLYQHYENVAKGPAYVRAHWIHFNSGGRVKVPEEYQLDLSPTHLTNKNVKDLRTANKLGDLPGNREMPTEECLRLWTELAQAQADAEANPKPKGAQIRKLTDIHEIMGSLGSDGMKAALGACLKQPSENGRPDLSVHDIDLRYTEAIKGAGDDIMVFGRDGEEESLYTLIRKEGARLVQEQMRAKVSALELEKAKADAAKADAELEQAKADGAQADAAVEEAN